MNTNDQRLNRITSLAFALVVLVNYVLIFTNRDLDTRRLVLLIGIGLVYVVLGTVNSYRLAQSTSMPLTYLYFGVQVILGGSIFILSDLSGWLVLMPLIAQAVFVLPARSSLLLSLIVWGVYVLPLTFIEGWLQSVTFAISIAVCIFFVYVFTQIAVNEQRARVEVEHLADELAAANVKLLEYAEQIEELAIAQERNRLAREIHDGLGHYLTAVNMQIKAAQAVLGQDPARALDAMGKAQSLTEEALADVRRSVAALRQAPPERLPLVEAIGRLVEENHAVGVEVEYKVHGEPRPLPAQTELALFRAVQEGLTNVRKHADASRVLLNLEFLPASVRLLLQDNGRGAENHSQEDDPAGFGLLGVRERVLLLGGQMMIETALDEGFNLVIELPG